MNADSGTQPATASTADDFVALLRCIRDQSGLTYRAIAGRAQANGDVLPASTLATMLARSTLPKRDLVAAFLRACGLPADDCARWLTAWGRLAAARNGRRPANSSADAIRAVPFQLPPEPPTVLGRGHETGRLLEAIARGGAVCVMEGTGGVGKTALALRVAHEIAHGYNGGCLYVDLQGAGAGLAQSEPQQVLARFIRALHGPAASGSLEEASAVFRTLTAADGVLVVLDNAASATQLRPLIPSGRNCTTLITSRWTLSDLDAAVRVELGPLPRAAGLTLLSSLVGSERVQAETAAALAIVERCGGLPLALRIAGARAAAQRDRPLTAFADRIGDEDDALDLLEVGDLSVRANLRLSYQAIDEATSDRCLASRLFRLAAVPDWSDAAPYACAAMLDTGVGTIDRALHRLAHAHLLEPAGGGRYRYHDIVRLFAREQAHAVDLPYERDLALGRLMSCLLAAAAAASRAVYPHERLPESASTPATPSGLRLSGTAQAWAWFEAEHTNLLMVARQCVASRRFLEQARDLAVVAVRLIDSAGYIAEHAQFGQMAIEAAEALGEQSGIVQANNIMAVAMLRQGRIAEGIRLLNRNLPVLRDLGNRASEAACLNNLGNALRDSGDLDGAVRHLTQALAIRRQLGDGHKEATVLDNLAVVYRLRGEHTRALAHHRAALSHARRGDNRMVEAPILLNYAETLHLCGDHREAVAQAQQSLLIYRGFAHQRGSGLALRILGNAHAGLGNTAEACRHWTEAHVLLDGLESQLCEELLASLDCVSSLTA
ncbi:MAG TPA: tetratricopeptide repeat protein [Candidatus Limnocylindrales bacterium]|nr:tetratricopeptide repeat protein [Candidatus Limnocylindrales bacterium]